MIDVFSNYNDVDEKEEKSVVINIPGVEKARGFIIPERAAQSQPKKVKVSVRHYEGTCAIEQVTISDWPIRYEFYNKFVHDAKKYWGMKGSKCPHQQFFSYMPQYEQMSDDQRESYLYWRHQVQNGSYPFVEHSFIMVYVYELINLHDVIDHDYAVEQLALLWREYRSIYPFLDKYIGQWLCDYILIHRVNSPYDIVKDFIVDAMSQLSTPEVLFPEFGKVIPTKFFENFAKQILKKSKFYTKETESLFNEHVIGSVEYAFNNYDICSDYKKTFPTKIAKDTYMGAIVTHSSKFQLVIVYRPLIKSKYFIKMMTMAVKYAENQMRAILGINSRYTITDLPDALRRKIDEYFATKFASQKEALSASIKSSFEKYLESKEDYLRYYEPENKSTADIKNAEAIEESAWQTAIDLGEVVEEEKEEQETIKEEQVYTFDNEYQEFWSKLPDDYREVLSCALGGNLRQECLRRKIMLAEFERVVNEVSFDAIGDSVIENGEFIEDYLEDLISSKPGGE